MSGNLSFGRVTTKNLVMDAMYRKGRYEAIMRKLNEIQTSAVDDIESQKIQVLQDEVNEIIESLRNRSEQADARVHYLLLIVPLVFILLWHSYAFQEFLSAAVILFTMVIALGLIHFRIGIAIKNSVPSMGINSNEQESQSNFIIQKLEYLNYALDIKKTRLVLLALFYIVFFPILLVKLYELAAERVAFDDSSTAYIVAYLIGGALWFFYYNRSFELYDHIDEEVELIRQSL